MNQHIADFIIEWLILCLFWGILLLPMIGPIMFR